MKAVEDGTINSDGVVLVTKDAAGEVKVEETADHMGRRGAKVGGGVGLLVGLFASPLLAAGVVGAAIGGVAGKFAKHRIASGIGDKMDESLPPGSAGVIAIYEHAEAETVDKVLANAIRKSTQIEKKSAGPGSRRPRPD